MSNSVVSRVEKRDGRLEPLRATKLARSICLALLAADEDCDLAFGLAAEVLHRLGPGPVAVSSGALGSLVLTVLLEAGRGGAAARFERAARFRRQRMAGSVALG